jgi:hypothetical protein
MAIGPISAAGLAQDVLSSGNSDQQEALQTLRNSLSSGNLTTAQSAFQALETSLQNSSSAGGSLLANNPQLNTDLTALGKALNSGNLATAQSGFTSVQADLKTAADSSAVNAASQSLQLVEGILSQLNPASSAATSTDNTTSILQSYYAGKSGLNVIA